MVQNFFYPLPVPSETKYLSLISEPKGTVKLWGRKERAGGRGQGRGGGGGGGGG
jgi:hypothetical protein